MVQQFDNECFDHVPLRAWSWDATSEATLERFGSITWAAFDGNPAHHCWKVIEQSFSSFLQGGSPTRDLLVAPPAEIVAEMRQHLSRRRRGRSTYIQIRERASWGIEASWLSGWELDREVLFARRRAGPGGTTEELVGRRSQGVCLVTPGEHQLSFRGSVYARGLDLRHEVDTSIEFVIEPGEPLLCELAVAVDDQTTQITTQWHVTRL